MQTHLGKLRQDSSHYTNVIINWANNFEMELSCSVQCRKACQLSEWQERLKMSIPYSDFLRLAKQTFYCRSGHFTALGPHPVCRLSLSGTIWGWVSGKQGSRDCDINEAGHHCWGWDISGGGPPQVLVSHMVPWEN